MSTKVYAFLPAKGSSERVGNKNQKVLAGEMLYVKGLKKLLKCKQIDEVIFDSESAQMHEEVNQFPIKHLVRDSGLASNSTDGHELLINEIKEFPDADIYVQYLCTSPFLKSSTIDEAIKFLKENLEYDSVVFMKREKKYNWHNGKPEYGFSRIPNSKDLPYTISEGMALYVIRKEAALRLNRRYGEKPHFIFGSDIEYVDINNLDELEHAEYISSGMKYREVERLNLLKHFISSSMLSDILDEFEWTNKEKAGSVVNGLSPNLTGRANVLFGRAKTLKLRKLLPQESAEGIYDAYVSYKFITNNDVIVVENPLQNNAYFGDLNTRLAIRAGASGAIISSVTRDSERVSAFNFPVYSSGTNAQDVRGRATVESINKAITINGERINCGDLIFADSDAIIVIYENFVDAILEKLMKKMELESSVSMEIINNLTTEQILEKEGGF